MFLETVIKRLTLQCFEERLTFLGRSDAVLNGTSPIPPTGNILELLVESAVFQILGTDQTRPSAGIDEVTEFDFSGAAVLARPGRRHRKTGIARRVVVGVIRVVFTNVQRCELDGVDPGAVEDLGAALACVSKHQVVRLGADHVPRIAVRSCGDDEIGV